MTTTNEVSTFESGELDNYFAKKLADFPNGEDTATLFCDEIEGMKLNKHDVYTGEYYREMGNIIFLLESGDITHKSPAGFDITLL